MAEPDASGSVPGFVGEWGLSPPLPPPTFTEPRQPESPDTDLHPQSQVYGLTTRQTTPQRTMGRLSRGRGQRCGVWGQPECWACWSEPRAKQTTCVCMWWGYLHRASSYSGTTSLRHRWDVEPRAPANQVRVSVTALDPRGPLLAATPKGCSEEGVDTAEPQVPSEKLCVLLTLRLGLVSAR